MADVPPPGSKTPARKVHDALRHPRLAREHRTIGAMVRIHCRDHHAASDGLCAECATLLDYATRRLDRCVFGDDKPTCANCKVHCYSASMRERVRDVMRYAGPRILWRHPVLALAHLCDGRRPAPDLPAPHRTRPEPAAQRRSDPDPGDPGPTPI
jgi:Nitrous oxide-stimulated promoter